MRAFVAVLPPPSVVQPLAQGWPALRAAYPDLSWVAPDRWHVTLAFLGELSSGQRQQLSVGLNPLAAGTAPLPARLSASGAFPSAARARALWVGVVSAGLDVLAEGVRRAAADARISLDGKPFRPHITIARSRADAAQNDVPLLLRTLTVADGATWEVSRFVLLESSGGPRPAYTELAAWPLTGLAGDPEL